MIRTTDAKPPNSDVTPTYTIIWFYVKPSYNLKVFKYAGASYMKALTKLREIEPASTEYSQSQVTGDTLYIKDTFEITDIHS